MSVCSFSHSPMCIQEAQLHNTSQFALEEPSDMCTDMNNFVLILIFYAVCLSNCKITLLEY